MQQPNAKALGHDIAKALVTLEVAILGLTVSFVQTSDRSRSAAGLFGLSWLFLVLAIAAGVLASGLVLHGVTEGKTTIAGFYLNVSLAFLVVASVFLALGGYRTVHGGRGISSAVDTSVGFVASAAHINDEASLTVKSVGVSAGGFQVRIETPAGLYTVTVDAESGQVRNYTAP